MIILKGVLHTLINLYFSYNPAADIPMSYGAVYLGIVLVFSGIGKIINILEWFVVQDFHISVSTTSPFFHSNIDKTYETKWKQN